MVTQKDIEEYLSKNVSYLFSLSLWSNALYKKGVLHPYIVNTYLYYNNSNKYLNILLKSNCIDDLNYCIEYNGKDLRYILPAYHNYEKFGNFILLQLRREPFIKDIELKYIESSKYHLLKNTYLYNTAIDIQKDTMMDLHKRIINEDEVLKGLLEIKYNCEVNHYWTLFDVEKETLTLEKIKSMNTELSINKAWLESKINLAESLSKIAYQDVLDNAKEIYNPTIIALGKQPEIDYEKIYNNVKEALIKKCGKPQYQIDIQGTKYPLMCNFIDFRNKLSKVIKKYKLEDIDKITNVLIEHINKLKSPLLKYYIEKDNNSNLASDYELYVESKEISKPQSFEI